MKFNAYETTLNKFIDTVLVVCPNCNSKAQVVYNTTAKKAVLSCTSCGHNKTTIFSVYSLGTNKDPFFNQPLWFQKTYQDGILWAYNLEHLIFLENHIRAELRERDIDRKRNQSIGSRLPKWMTSKKNRKELLRGIHQLKNL